MIRKIFTGAMLLLQLTAISQKFEQVKQQYPDQDAVQLLYSRDLRFFMKDGQLQAESYYQQELMLLNERTASLFSKSGVYHSGFNELTALEGFTLFPDGKKKQDITEKKTSAATSNSIFYDDGKETTFNFPSLQQGAVTVTRYTLLHKEPRLLGPFLYGASVPGIKVAFTVTVPEGIEINYLVRNDTSGKFVFTTEKKRGQTIYRWEMNNAKNETRYNDAPDEYYYMPHVIVYVKSYNNGTPQKVFGSVDDLYKWNYAFLKNLNKDNDPMLKALADSLVKGKKDPLEKVAAVYQWVQSNIKYVAFENGLEGFRPRQAADVCRKKYGDCKDMSSVITRLLQLAGIESYYTWIGTRDLPYRYSEVPLPIVDNHMISTARIGDRWYFLDGTAPNALLDLPPYHIQGKEALVAISENEYKVLTVPVAEPQVNKVIDSTFIRLTDNGITGNQKVDYKGYFASDIWDALLYSNDRNRQDFVKSKMGKGSNKFILGKYEIAEKHDLNNARISAEFEIPGYGKKIGNEYYLNLNLEKLWERQFIDTAKRKVPRSLEYMFTIEQHHILDIPEGYEVTYRPDDLLVENEFYRVEIRYVNTGKKLIATQKVTNKALMVQASDFPAWNKDLPTLDAHYKEQIVLEKK